MKDEESINRVGSHRIALMLDHIFNKQSLDSEEIAEEDEEMVEEDMESPVTDINTEATGEDLVG